MAADIRKVRPPEPYKGKGIRYVGEHVRRKAGKAGKVSLSHGDSNTRRQARRAPALAGSAQDQRDAPSARG